MGIIKFSSVDEIGIDQMGIDQIGVDQVGSYPSFIAGDVIISVVEIMYFYNLMEKS